MHGYSGDVFLRGTLSEQSTRRAKTDIESFLPGRALAQVIRLRGVTYNMLVLSHLHLMFSLY